MNLTISACVRWLGLCMLPAIILSAAAPARGESTFEFIGTFRILDLSYDGSAGAGLTQDGFYENCYWSESEGLVPLGMSSVEVLGRGGGHAAISQDGTRIGGTIITADSLLVTQGRWTHGQGWEELMPPTPPDGGALDDKLGSVWDLSGDGETAVGLYWRPGATDGSAHASAWTTATGVIDLGSQGSASRANAVNHDGTVVGGWSSDPTGAWQPTVFENGTVTVLNPTPVACGVEAISADGDFVAGNAYESNRQVRTATYWERTDTGWQETMLTTLPGTFGPSGFSTILGISDDKSLLVGLNKFDAFSSTGFVWTEELGMLSAADYATHLGITLPPEFVILQLRAVSGDGKVIAGYGAFLSTPGTHESFLIRLDDATDVPQIAAAGDRVLRPSFPNPFRSFHPYTSLRLSLGQSDDVQLQVFDVHGRAVRTLHDGPLAAGDHTLRWDGRNRDGQRVPSGVYFTRARGASGLAESQRVTVLE